MSERRTFLQRLASLPLLGSFAPASFAASRPRDVFKELGVRTFINAAGTYTAMTASLMPPEVMDAMFAASKHFVSLTELQDKVGARIATIIGSESAMVTSGAAAALTCGTAACLTGTDQKAIVRLPELSGLKNEVLIQKSHRFGYDHAVRATGIRMVEIETGEELDRAAGTKTAMMLFFNDAEPKGQIKAEEWVALGRKHKVPTFIDASADVPPVTNLKRFSGMGFDLVTYSGGKGIRGPQSAGILGGRKDLIEAARLNTSPYSDSIARGMKVNKEEMVGMLTALELYIAKDHQAEWKEWERRIQKITDSVGDLPSVKTETFVPPIANHVPHLRIKWEQAKIALSPPEVLRTLREGEPSIECSPFTNQDELVIGVWMMQPGEAEVVARRVRAVLRGKTSA